jgi:hypothetical protein
MIKHTNSPPNIIREAKSRRVRWAEDVARMVEVRVVYRIVVGNPERKRKLGRCRRRWVETFKIDL